LQKFYADQVPAAVGTNFTVVSVDGNFIKAKLQLSYFSRSLKAGPILKNQQMPVMKPISTPSLLLVFLTQLR
jgi:hypothetical protein